jgi:uncharacterized membrane protein
VVVLLLSCIGKLGVEDTVDTAPDACAEVPVLRWTNFGEGFITGACQGCHASTATDRFGAPEDVTFDTVEETWFWSSRILARAASEDPTMPPEGGVDADDRQRLTWWLECAPEGS